MLKKTCTKALKSLKSQQTLNGVVYGLAMDDDDDDDDDGRE